MERVVSGFWAVGEITEPCRPLSTSRGMEYALLSYWICPAWLKFFRVVPFSSSLLSGIFWPREEHRALVEECCDLQIRSIVVG